MKISAGPLSSADYITPIILITIKNLIETIARLTGITGEIRWDPTKPDGQPRRSLDTARAKKLFNFQAKTDFETGLKATIDWYLRQPG